MNKQDMIELEWIIKQIKLAKQDMLNNPRSSASDSVLAVLYAYDTLLARIEEKSKKVA